MWAKVVDPVALGYNDIFRWYTDNQLIRSENTVNYRDSTTADRFWSISHLISQNSIGIQGMGDCDNYYPPYEIVYDQWLDDSYIDITPARVELCNAATKAQATVCETQIPHTQWDGSTIQFTVNLGSFTSTNGLYLIVFDENNVASNGFAVNSAPSANLIASQDFEQDGWQSEFRNSEDWEDHANRTTHDPYAGSYSLRWNQFEGRVDPITGLPGEGGIALDWRGGTNFVSQSPNGGFVRMAFRHDDYNNDQEARSRKLMYIVDDWSATYGGHYNGLYVGRQFGNLDVKLSGNNYLSDTLATEIWGGPTMWTTCDTRPGLNGEWVVFELYIDYNENYAQMWMNGDILRPTNQFYLDNYPELAAEGKILLIDHPYTDAWRIRGITPMYFDAPRDCLNCYDETEYYAGVQIDNLEFWDGIPSGGQTSFCGDGSCNGGETPSSCPQDCGTPAVCLNGVQEVGEDCDLSDLNGQSCVSLGFDGGTLACTSSCSFDTSGCYSGCTSDPECDDGNECTSDVCSNFVCSHNDVPYGTSCSSDGVACTNDVCSSGVCGVPDDGLCTPDQGCTGVYCSGGGCVSTGCPTPDSIELWLEMEGNFLDSSDNNNVFSCSSCPSSVSGINSDGAYDFDGSNWLENQNTLVGLFPSNNPEPNQFSLSAWINVHGDLNDRHVIVNKESQTAGRGFSFAVINGFLNFQNDGDSGEFVSGSIPILANVDTHVAVTHDGSTVRLYVDGVLDGTINYGLPPQNNAQLEVGRYTWGGYSRYFNGVIDDVRVYSVALSDSEVGDVMSGVVVDPVLPGDLNDDGVVNLVDFFASASLSEMLLVGRNLGRVA